jgi:hypothetical protein
VSKLIDFGEGLGLTLDDDSCSSHVRNDETSSTMIIDWQKAVPEDVFAFEHKLKIALTFCECPLRSTPGATIGVSDFS